MWPQARNFYNECGPYQIAAVLRERGQDPEVEELYVSSLHRRRDWTLPWNLASLLQRNGVAASWRFVSSSSFGKYLRHAVTSGATVIFVIFSIRGKGRTHWISARGYDEEADAFICYDSQCETSYDPLGNILYTAAQLSAALPWPVTAAIEVR